MVATIRLADAKFRPGDILVHHAYWPDADGKPDQDRPISLLAAGIAEMARGFCYHIAVLDWTQRGWVAIEMVPPVGQEDPIAARVAKYPGTIHWLRVPDVVALSYDAEEAPSIRHYDRDAAVRKAREYIGKKYGFDTIRRDWLDSSFGRWFSELPSDDEILEYLPVCSTCGLDAVQTGFGGWDVIRHLHLALTQPEDVNRISFLQDMRGLVP